MATDTPQKIPCVVRKTQANETKAIVDILTEAFETDPVLTWLSDRAGYKKWAFTKVIPAFVPHEEMYITDDDLGASLWLPPGIPLAMPIKFSLIWEICRRFGLGYIARGYSLTKLLKKLHPKEKHYYLYAIGVRPKSQGRGIGSALLRKVLEKCDSEGMPAYLENSKVRNLPLYERHGFKIMKETTLPRGGPRIWFMYREPLRPTHCSQ